MSHMLSFEELMAQTESVQAELEAAAQRERELLEDPSKAVQPTGSGEGFSNNEYNIFNCPQYKPRIGTNVLVLTGALPRRLAQQLAKEQGLGDPMPFGTGPDYYWIHRTHPGFVVSVPVNRSFGVTYDQSKDNCFSHVNLVHRTSNWNVRNYPRPQIPTDYHNPVLDYGAAAKKGWMTDKTEAEKKNWKRLAPAAIYCCDPDWEFATNVVDITDYVVSAGPGNTRSIKLSDSFDVSSLKMLPWRMPKTMIGDHKLARKDANDQLQNLPQFHKNVKTGEYELYNQAGLFGAIETFAKNDPSYMSYIPGMKSMPFVLMFNFAPKADAKYTNIEILMLGRDNQQQSVPEVQKKFAETFGHFFDDVENNPIFDKIAYTSPQDLQKHFDNLMAGKIPVYKRGHSGPVNNVKDTSVEDKMATDTSNLKAIRAAIASKNSDAVVNLLEEAGSLKLAHEVRTGITMATTALTIYAKQVLPADDAAAIESELRAIESLGLGIPSQKAKPIMADPHEFGFGDAPQSLHNSLVDDL